MDNRHFDIIDESGLHEWVKCCIGDRTAVGWSTHERTEADPQRIVFYEFEAPEVKGYAPLPFAAGGEHLAFLIEGWLQAKACYGKEPEHDGDNGRGFRLYNEGWGHVDGNWQAFMAVSPAWAMYGK